MSDKPCVSEKYDIESPVCFKTLDQKEKKNVGEQLKVYVRTRTLTNIFRMPAYQGDIILYRVAQQIEGEGGVFGGRRHSMTSTVVTEGVQ